MECAQWNNDQTSTEIGLSSVNKRAVLCAPEWHVCEPTMHSATI